jgi:hypothetical protein
MTPSMVGAADAGSGAELVLFERLGFRRTPALAWEFEPGEWLWADRLDV